MNTQETTSAEQRLASAIRCIEVRITMATGCEQMAADNRQWTDAAKWRTRISAYHAILRILSPNAALCDPAHGDAGKPKTL